VQGHLWDRENSSVVHLRTPQAVIEKIAYVIANPVTTTDVRIAERT
jgi:hypothetical protein